MGETHRADISVEQDVATKPIKHDPDWRLPIRLLPGIFAALLFLILATRDTLLGRATVPTTALLIIALGAAVAAQPAVARSLRRLMTWQGLAHTAVVIAVVALAAGLRFWGLRFGLPYHDHPDEWAVADRALRMLRTGDYDPHAFLYPTLYTYLQLCVAVVHFLVGVSAGWYRTVNDIDPARYYAWARALTALLGSASVLLTYGLGRLLYNRIVGLIAALFLAGYPSAVGDAHYITTDTPSMFFTLLAFLAIAWLGLHPPARRRDEIALALIAGFGVGLAMATKYNVAVLVVPLVVALFTRANGSYEGQEASAEGTQVFFVFRPLPFLYSLVGILLAFTLGTPFWVRDLPLFLNEIASVIVHYKFIGHPGAESSRPALFYWGAFVNEGALLAWCCLAGTLLAFLRHRRSDILILAFGVPYFIQMTGVKVVFFRNIMPLLPFMCLLAAAFLLAMTSWLRLLHTPKSVLANGRAQHGPIYRLRARLIRREALLMMVLLIITAQPIVNAARNDWLRAQPTTRILATDWIEQHAKDGTRIWLEDQTLILPSRLRVQGGKPITQNAPSWYREQGFRYLVVNEDVGADDRAKLAQFGQPAARFAPEQERYGPTFSIYDTGFGDVTHDQRTPSGATLQGGAVVLDGYRHAGEAKAGTVLPLALYWRVERKLSKDYIVFVHLLDARGNKVAQRDLPPLDGSNPTSHWQPGDFIRDDQDLTLPQKLPPGTYNLVVGMYDGQTMAAINDTGPINIGQVVVR